MIRRRKAGRAGQRLRQKVLIAGARDFKAAQAGQMRRQELGVEQLEPARPQDLHGMGQRDL